MTATIFEFHGGIHPPEHKLQSTQTPIAQLPLPHQLIVPVNQHKGAPAKVVVKVGDPVLKGQLLAEANGYVSAPLHAPSSGVISAIELRPVAHPSGLPERCIVIDTDGRDQWVALDPAPDYQQLEPQALLEKIYQAGVVGLGGAVFPTATKLSSRSRRKIHTLVINGAECEPYISADDLQMRERADQIISGIKVIAHLLDPEQVIVGIEDNKPQAIEAMYRAAIDTDITIQAIPTKYPSGDAKRLIRILTGVSIPGGTLSVDQGILCVNTGTAAAVQQAVILGQPLISRICTLTGAALTAPQNVDVLIGTPIQALLAFAGLQEEKLQRLVMGGPMMGFTLERLDLPVVKATNCLIAATAEEFPPAPPAQACIRCGHCAEACPANLLPQQLFWYARADEQEQLRHHNLFDCIECGACAYVCPSSIPLVQYYRAAKGSIREQELKNQKAEHSKARFEARQARLATLEAEKEAKRQANAERAAQLKKAPSQTATSADSSKADAIRAAMERAKQRKSGAVAAKPALSPEQKQLKIQRAMVQAELKKNQRKLERLSGSEKTQLEQAITQLEQQLQKLQAQQNEAETSVAPPATPPVDDKKRKIQQAMAKAAVKKLQRQLDSCDENDKPALEEQLQGKQAELDALLAAHTAPAQTAAPSKPAKPALDDEKKRKIQQAMAKAAVKKLQRQLDNCDESDKPTLEKQLQGKQAELDALLAANTAPAQPAAPSKPANPALDDEKKRKIQQAMAKAAVKKLQRQLDNCDESDKPALEEQLQGKQAELDALLAANTAPAQTTAASKPAKPALDDEQKLKIKRAMAQSALKKAQRRYADALANNDPEQDALAETVRTLEADFSQADLALTALLSATSKESV